METPINSLIGEVGHTVGFILGAMKRVGRRIRRVGIALGIVFALTHANTGVSATASNPKTQAISSDPFLGYLQSSDGVINDLISGLRKLRRICGLAPVPDDPVFSMTKPELSLDISSSLNSARTTIQNTQVEVSRLVDASALVLEERQPFICRASLWLPGCEPFRQQRQTLDAARLAAKQLFTEAHQRLALYQQYAELEAMQCTRPGFTQRLWLIEKTHLFPLVIDAPVFFRNTLRQGGSP